MWVKKRDRICSLTLETRNKEMYRIPRASELRWPPPSARPLLNFKVFFCFVLFFVVFVDIVVSVVALGFVFVLVYITNPTEYTGIHRKPNGIHRNTPQSAGYKSFNKDASYQGNETYDVLNFKDKN